MQDFLKNIDFSLLRKQKLTLLKLKGLNKKQDEHLNGILFLIDRIQDAAVENGYTEKQVFNL